MKAYLGAYTDGHVSAWNLTNATEVIVADAVGIPYSLRNDQTMLLYAAPPMSMSLEIETATDSSQSSAPSLCTCDVWNNFEHYQQVWNSSCADTIVMP